MIWPLKLYRIAGESMLPTYRPGDLAIGWRWFRPKPGQAVVTSTPRPLLKRIKHLNGSHIWLEGDNASSSTDSRHFGSVNISKLEALVITVIKSNE